MWAYHGTNVYHGHRKANLDKEFWDLPPEQIGYYHLSNLAMTGLEPRVSTRQTLAYRKSRLKGRLREKFVYYYSEPLDASSVYMLVTNYGEGLTIGSGGMLLRFPEPKISWPDPDTNDDTCRMTDQAIHPEQIEMLVPPKKYYQLLGGSGNQAWSPWDYADRYLLQHCIYKDKYWEPLTEFINPWANQEDYDLTSLGRRL